MQPSRELSDLVKIMAALRTPETGCPWDLVQDFSTIAPYTIEEAYEVADAIERQDWDDLRDELGDLLLQPIYHARMAEEAGLFDFNDVIEAITTKMIRRHPHVFGDEKQRQAGMAKGAWEKIKSVEKAEKSARKTMPGINKGHAHSLMDDIPSTLPALQSATKIQKRAASVGFDWPGAEPVVAKLHEEIGELEAALKSEEKSQIEREIGDVLFTLANLCRHLDIDPDRALRASNSKFRSRFSHIERQLVSANRSLEDAELDEMEGFWQEAKKIEAAEPNPNSNREG